MTEDTSEILAQLEWELKKTDAKVQQYTEGLLSESEWQKVKQDRAKLREQISWYQHPKQ